jgi:hypothetical protein
VEPVAGVYHGVLQSGVALRFQGKGLHSRRLLPELAAGTCQQIFTSNLLGNTSLLEYSESIPASQPVKRKDQTTLEKRLCSTDLVLISPVL